MSYPVSLSMVDNGPGIGHYKGVMLCNRPFGGSVATNGKSSQPSSNTFSCGVVPEALGQNIPIPLKEKMLKRPKKDSVLVKHKKWLAELQKTKERLEEEYIADSQHREEAQKKFQEHEKKMRSISCNIFRNEKKQENYEVKDSIDEKDPLSSSFSNNGVNNKKDTIKPAWAVSEEMALAQSEAKQAQEEDDLLDFAKGLDYERYIGDLEVQVMMERLRRRIGELEREVAAEDQREADIETRAARREMLALMGDAENSLRKEADENISGDRQVLNSAKALLGEEEEIGAVHSTKSVVSLLKAAKEKIVNISEAVKGPTRSQAEPKVTNEPRIIVHEPSDGKRLETKNDINNLPYMHRNPAV